MYRYNASARGRALKLLPLALGFLVAAAVCLYLWWTVVFAVLGAIFALIGLFLLVMSLIWLVGGGRWQIRVDDEGIDWRAPPISEGSFRYRLDQIDCVRKRIRTKTKSDGRTKTKVDHLVVAHDGTTHRLVNQSGVDVDTVVQALLFRGVRFEEERVPTAR